MNNETDTFETSKNAERETSAQAGSSTGSEASKQTTLLTEADITELMTKAAKAEEHWDRLLRMSAEFDNFKKRAARDRQDAIRYANESLLEKLIPALDNFEMALAAAQGSDSTPNDAIKTGVNMVYQHLKGVMADAGLETLDASQGAFDPNWQEAVSQVQSHDVPEGHVVQQLRKGYRLKDRLLRPAKVIVARKSVE